MSILNADNLGVSFGAFDLFKGISVSIANDSKIGLIGPNGVGKTTLLLILAGINPPTSGKCTWRAGGAWAICARRRWTPFWTATTRSTPRC